MYVPLWSVINKFRFAIENEGDKKKISHEPIKPVKFLSKFIEGKMKNCLWSLTFDQH